MTRRIVHRTRGHGHGPIVRLMSPSDLGEELKPFVFLDLFEADMRALAGGMPVHPHRHRTDCLRRPDRRPSPLPFLRSHHGAPAWSAS